MKRFIKCVAFVLIVGIIIFSLNSVYTVNHIHFVDTWSSSSTIANFYNEPRGSIDVLIFGTSTVSNGVQPAVLWNERKFTSYNLSTEKQFALSAYYMLQDALKYQQPRVVVLNARWLTSTTAGDPDLPEVDRDSGALHLALDYMKLSAAKLRAAQDIASQSETQSLAEYLLPLYLYHGRNDITQNDFDLSFVSAQHPLKGGCIHLQTDTDVPVNTGMADPAQEASELSAMGRDYVDRMIELCRSKGIAVVLLALPFGEWTWGQHYAVSQYADVMGVDFLDMNVPEVYDALSLDTDTDYRDYKHETISGSTKTSRYIAAYLAENYDLGRDYPEDVAASFDASYDEYMRYSRIHEWVIALSRAEELSAYLTQLAGLNDCIVVISARDEFTQSLTPEQKSALAALGPGTDFNSDIFRYSYAAIIDSGSVVFEECSPGRIEYDYKSPEGISVSVISAGAISGDASSIVINGREYSLNMRGLNIVVYSRKAGLVIDSVSFDSFAGALADRGDKEDRKTDSGAQPNSFSTSAKAEAIVLSMS